MHHGHGGCHPDYESLRDRPKPEDGVWAAFHYAMVAQRHLMAQTMAQEGIHPGQAMCLRYVSSCPEISPSELADRLHVSRPTVTGMIQRLEKSGYVERRTDENDQRSIRLVVTEAGRALGERLNRGFAQVVESSTEGFSERDKADLERLLLRLADNFAAAMHVMHGQDAATGEQDA